MTDNEIIKALERLHKRILQSKCAEEITETEIMGLVNAFDLINRQKEEIERLRKGFTADADYFASEYDNNIKAEAIKEFAERLKGNLNKDFRIYGNCTVYDFVKHTDNLVKEMTEVETNQRKEDEGK